MSAKTQPLTKRQNAGVRQFPCDGIPRYQVGKKSGLSYSQAWDAIFKESHCTETKPKLPGERTFRSFTREGVRRLSDLNDRYIGLARDFIIAQIAEQQLKAKAAKDAQQHDAEQPPQSPAVTPPADVAV